MSATTWLEFVQQHYDSLWWLAWWWADARMAR